MIDKIKSYVSDGLENGFSVPKVKDGVGGEPSYMLYFAYVTFFVALMAELYFIVKGDPLASTTTAIVFWALAMVFLRVGTLDKVKLNIKSGEFELDGDDDDTKSNKD